MKDYILAIDQGTTGTTSMIFDRSGTALAKVNQEFPQYFPREGWVEHDLDEIWQSVLATLRKALDEVGIAADDLASIGITIHLICNYVRLGPVYLSILQQLC